MDAASVLKGMTPPKVGRASRTPGQLWQVPAFGIGVLAFLLAAATAPLRLDHAGRRFHDDCQLLRLACESTKERAGDYVQLAQSVIERAPLFSAEAGIAYLLAGSLYQRLAEEAPAEQAEANRGYAIALLEKAVSLGVPEDDHAPLLYRLGKMLFESGRDLARALDYLSKSVERGTDQPARGYGMLVEGYLRLPAPNLDAALVFSQKQLESSETDMDLWQCHLLRGDLFLRKRHRLAALQELDAIPPAAPKAILLPARLLQTTCCREEKLWSRAIPLWKDLLKHAGEVPIGKAAILYHLGLCYHRAENPNDSAAQTLWTEAVNLGGEAGQAAGLRLGEMHLLGEPAHPGKGLGDWTRALLTVEKAEDYKNELVPPAQARALFEAAWREYQGKRDYRRAEELARLYKKLAEYGRADERLAQSLQGRARELTERAKESGPQAETRLSEARELFARAGAIFEFAAQSRGINEQPALLSQSAACLMPAREYARAVVVLQRFVQMNNSEDALAEGWLKLADSYRALGQRDSARTALHKCIEFGTTPFAYRARYQLALDAIAGKDFDQAEETLRQNLRVTGPFIDRPAHEQSRYRLAFLLFERQRYDMASDEFKEAIRQYPQNPQFFQARDRLGLCYRLLADDIFQKLQARLSDEEKAHYKKAMRDYLDDAHRVYQSLADDLQASKTPLSPTDAALLVEAEFAVADLHLKKDELAEALRRYEALLDKDKHRGHREGLRACTGIWTCALSMQHGSAQMRELALNSLREAVTKTLMDVSSVMNDDNDAFRGPGRLSRQQWLDQLRQAHKQLTGAVNPSTTNSQ
jgi:tetratricopeptide (TPR) repeat protein